MGEPGGVNMGGTHISITQSVLLPCTRRAPVLYSVAPSPQKHGRIRRPFSRYDGPYCTPACMCMFRACLGEPTGRGVACHDMHDALPLASTRLFICAQIVLGCGRPVMVVGISACSSPSSSVVCLLYRFFFYLPSSLSCSCHASHACCE